MSSNTYPSKILRRGDSGSHARLVQKRLAELGIAPLKGTGTFGPDTEAAVKLFQIRYADPAGRALEVDGVVGPLTWAALFGAPAVGPVPALPPPGLATEALAAAIERIGVSEQPPGSNRGPEVDNYLRTAGIDPTKGSFAWCQAFVYFCFVVAIGKLGRSPSTNPVPRTAGVLNHWRRAPACAAKIAALAARDNPKLVAPGALFFISSGGGFGHVGFVERVEIGGHLVTVEGNTNDGGSREGTGVFRRRRRLTAVNLGFLDYADC